MVNTFLLCEDYLTSARQLDTQRLQKQCLEAYQILVILFQFQLILHSNEKIDEFARMVPRNPSDNTWNLHKEIEKSYRRADLLKKIACEYRRSKIRYVRYPAAEGSDAILYNPIATSLIPYRVKKDDVIECVECGGFISHDKLFAEEDGCTHLHLTFFFLVKPKGIDANHFTPIGVKSSRHPKRNGYSISRFDVCRADTEIVGMGYAHHPIVRMWVGYESSLYEYLTAHLTALEERGRSLNVGHKSFFDRIPLKTEPIKPWWISHHHSVIMSHRASLLRKELYAFPPKRHTLSAGDPPKYIDNPLIATEDVVEWLPHGYVWTIIPLMTPAKFLSSVFPSKEICSPPQHYEPRFTDAVLQSIKH